MKKLLLTLFILGSITGCSNGGAGSDANSSTDGGSGNGNSSPTLNSQFSKLVIGQLYTDNFCTNNNVTGTSNKAYFTRINDTDWAFEKDYWSGLNCNTGTVTHTTKLIKRFISQSPLQADQSFDNINHSVVSIEMMILDANMLTTYNTSSYYTFNDWTISAYKNISCKKPQTNSPYTEVCSGSIFDEQFKVDESFTPFIIYYSGIYEFQ